MDEIEDDVERVMDELRDAPRVHIYPTNDYRLHELSELCWCTPVEKPLIPCVGWASTGMVLEHRFGIGTLEVPECLPPTL